MADNTNNSQNFTHSVPSGDDPGPPEPKVPRVGAVEEVKDTVMAAIQEALKNFTTPAGGK